jgi:beta-mannosidase
LRLEVTLINQGGPVLLAHFQLRGDRTGRRVLPAFYSDNYLNLVPAEHRTITIEAALEDLKGEQPKVFLDGWNVVPR